MQIGPAINGTALRDVTGTVDFNEFTNQLEFQEVATEFNNLSAQGSGARRCRPGARSRASTIRSSAPSPGSTPRSSPWCPIVFEVEQ